MGNGSTATKPEHVLMEFFTDPLGFQGALAIGQRLEHIQRGLHQPIVGEHTPEPYVSSIGVHSDQGMDAVLGP